MEHRRSVQVDRAARPQAFAERIQRIQHQIAMAEHDALGTAGGAAGVEDAAEVLALAHCIHDRRTARDQALVVLHAGGCLAVIGIDEIERKRGCNRLTSIPCGDRAKAARLRPGETGGAVGLEHGRRIHCKLLFDVGATRSDRVFWEKPRSASGGRG